MKWILAQADLADDLQQIQALMREYSRVDMEIGAGGDMLDAVMDARGKMVRPILLLLCGRLGPQPHPQRLHKAAALVELVHMASLVHDDVVDDSPLRRGKPTVQARFGSDMAVYTGDFILSQVMQRLFSEDMTATGQLLGQTIEKMCRGEMDQYECRYDTSTTIDNYLHNIEGKTAALLSAACRIGAMEAGCPVDVCRQMARFGKHVGYIFQMRDDVLDFVSTKAARGKPVHADFAYGIYTLPVLYTFSSGLYGPALQELAHKSRTAPLTSQELARITEVTRQSGGVAFTEKLVRRHAQQAEKILAELSGDEKTLSLLWQFTRWLARLEQPQVQSVS